MPPTGPGVPDEIWSDLLRRVRDRDQAAARELVAQLHPLVARTVQAHRPGREETADLVQEVFGKVFANLEQFRGDSPFPHWVSRITVRVCIDRLRHHRRRPVTLWSELTDDEKRTLAALERVEPSDPAVGEAGEILARLLAALAPDDRLLITWLDLEQKSVADVAALTGWNRGRVHVKAFRARRRLRKLFETLDQPPAP